MDDKVDKKERKATSSSPAATYLDSGPGAAVSEETLTVPWPTHRPQFVHWDPECPRPARKQSLKRVLRLPSKSALNRQIKQKVTLCIVLKSFCAASSWKIYQSIGFCFTLIVAFLSF